MIRTTLRLLLIVAHLYLSEIFEINGLATSDHATCAMGQNCHLPNCLCRSYDPPGGLNKTNIPQIILFTFDGPLDERAYQLYQDLFPSSLRNPNGCSVRVTLFLQGNTTDYSLVADMYERKVAEIAVSSMSNKPKEYWQTVTYEDLVSEAYGQKMMIHELGHIPLRKIVGYRSPFLQPSEALYRMLTNTSLGFKYDSSLVIRKSRLGEDVVWPFSLDYGWPEQCVVSPCPSMPLVGLWEMPVYTLIDLDGFDRISHTEFLPNKAKPAFRYLVQNFRTFYRRNRTPFVLNLSPQWLYHNQTFAATKRFIKRLMSLDDQDVYLLSVSDALEWIRSPRDTPDSTNFTAWKCSMTDINPAPIAPRSPDTVSPAQEYLCLSVSGVYTCVKNTNTSTSTTSTVPTIQPQQQRPTPSSESPQRNSSLPSSSPSAENQTLCCLDYVNNYIVNSSISRCSNLLYLLTSALLWTVLIHSGFHM